MPNPSSTPVLTLDDVSFGWPDGTSVFTGLSVQVPPGVSALVGANGSGKTTLLELAAGTLEPASGRVVRSGTLGVLPQDLTADPERPVPDALGVAATLDALERIGNGSTDPADYEAVDDDWDLAERTTATLARLGLPSDTLNRRLGELSGGEVVQLGLVRLALAAPDLLLLDEPTNNLDAESRERLRAMLATWRGSVLVVTHDRELLRDVDRIGELTEAGVRWYGGGLDAYEEQVRTEQQAAEQAVTTARADVRRQRADLVDSERVLANRRAYGRKMYAIKREPRAVMRARKRQQQVSAAKYTKAHEDRLDQARERLDDAESKIRADEQIRVDLPGTAVPVTRVVLDTDALVLRTGLPVDLHLRGPERVAILGPNGSGKTTLLRTLTGHVTPASGTTRIEVPVGYLPQRIPVPEAGLSVVDLVRRSAPGAEQNAIRSRLARFGFRGRTGDQEAATLSGGERFRAVLAAILLADPAPQLLVLDEPTNNLDFGSVEALVSSLEGYGGALLVASHDQDFLDEIGIDRVIAM